MSGLFKAAAAAVVVSVLSLPAVARADEAEIAAAIGRWQDHFNAGDAKAAVEAMFTEDARLLPPKANMVEGREAITAFWQAAMDSPVHDLELGLVSAEILGDTAIETGTWALMVPAEDGSGEIRATGKTLVIWKKGADGTWRMSQDMWNDSPGS